MIDESEYKNLNYDDVIEAADEQWGYMPVPHGSWTQANEHQVGIPVRDAWSTFGVWRRKIGDPDSYLEDMNNDPL